MSEECPNCRQITNASFSRLVKDTCGHTKCRMCLLYEEQGCKTCHDEHRIQTIGNFDCPTSRKQIPNNTSVDIKNSIATEEIVLPLELVINKDSKFKENHFEFVSPGCIPNSESNCENNTSENNRDRTTYESSIPNDNSNILNSVYIPKIEPCNMVTNIHTHNDNNNSGTSSESTCNLATIGQSGINDLKVKLEFTDQVKLLKNKHSKYPDRSHISVVPGIPERYKCNICGKIFRNKKGKCYHDACITGIRPYQCKFCDRSFVKRSHYEYHERVHSGYKPYKCHLCDKAFPQQNKLNRHMYSHNKEKQFVCPKCNKRYSKQNDLKNHLHGHNGTTTYNCKACEKSFHLLTNLKRHMRTHTSERPHICDQCNKSFKDKSLLIRHKRTHGKDRPFSCAHCNRVFLSKSELRRHLMVHTDEKPFSCEYCETVFRRKDNLNRHIRHHHSEDTNLEINNLQKITSSTNPKLIRTKQSNLKQKQKSKKTQRTVATTPTKSPVKVSVVYINSHDQINSRLDPMGNITPVIRTTGELSNAVPVINGPISIRKLEDKTDPRKKMFTYTEPIPLEKAVVINRRIEEKLYPQNTSSHSYFFRNHANHVDKQSASVTQSVRPNFNIKIGSLNKSPHRENLLSEVSTQLQNDFVHCNTASTLSLTKDFSTNDQVCLKDGIVSESTKSNSNLVDNSVDNSKIVVKVISINQSDQAESIQDNVSVVPVKHEQSNYVSTIKKHTGSKIGSNICNDLTCDSNHFISIDNTSLPQDVKNPNSKKQSNIHWRRRTAEILKPNKQYEGKG